MDDFVPTDILSFKIEPLETEVIFIKIN